MLRFIVHCPFSTVHSGSADAEGIGNPVDVVEPGRDQGDLKNSLVVESNRAHPMMIFRRDARRVLGQLHDIVQHHALGFRNGSRREVALQRLDQIRI